MVTSKTDTIEMQVVHSILSWGKRSHGLLWRLCKEGKQKARASTTFKDNLHFAVLTSRMTFLLPALNLNFTLTPEQGHYKLDILAIRC